MTTAGFDSLIRAFSSGRVSFRQFAFDESGGSAGEYALIAVILAAAVATVMISIPKTAEWPDLFAVLAGLVAASISLIRRDAGRWNVTRTFNAFFSGASTGYLILLIYSITLDRQLLTTILASNVVLLVGALLVAAWLNVAAIFRTLRPPEDV